ncbi:hypothetical protein NQ040_04920 [Staphylococcus cohnii]|uniref:hypothetical protein n=2 Tax=Staphylococcus TaxID=1279 RepID=UPI0034D39949|nr:hypothetical protein [Staphylococcus cohnii]
MMKLYLLLMSLIITITILLALHTEDIFISFVTYMYLSMGALVLSKKFKLKEHE